MFRSTNSFKQGYFYIVRLSLNLSICSILLSGCEGKPLLNPEPFGELFEARNNLLSAAEVLKKQDNPSTTEHGRELYNAAADPINALIDEASIAIYAHASTDRSFLSDFKNRLGKAVKATANFQSFVAKEVENGSAGREQSLLPISTSPVDIASLLGQIDTALQNARQANLQQRDKIVGVLEALKLVPFDQVGAIPESKSRTGQEK